jgi:pilus assembly protein CpaB
MRISSGTLVLGVFATLFGLVGAYVAKQHFAEPPVEVVQEEKPGPELLSVPTASMDLPAGRTIKEGDLIVRKLTWDQIRQLDLPSEFMGKTSQLIDRTLRVPLPKGMVFQPVDLYPEGTGPSVAEKLRPGYRAVSLALENSYAELSLLSPGAVVDILFRTFPEKDVPETTVTLLENVEILAIGEQTIPGGQVIKNSDGRAKAAITMACTPDQAAALKVVEGKGSLSMALRGKVEAEEVPAEQPLVSTAPPPQTLATLLDLPTPQQPMTTQIYRRGQVSTTMFNQGTQVGVDQGFTGLPVPATRPRRDVASDAPQNPQEVKEVSTPAVGRVTDTPGDHTGTSR